MFVSLFGSHRPTFMLEGADDGGSGGGGAPTPGGGGAVVAPPAAPAAPAAPAVPDPNAPPVVDWNARVVEWGGEDSVKSAIELQKALQTRDGVRALADESLRALGIGDAAIAALFGPAASTETETVEQLLADPERTLTAGELKRVLESERVANRSEIEQRTHAQSISTAIAETTRDLKISDEDRPVILALADRFMSVPANQATPAQVAEALKKANDAFGQTVKKAADAYIESKKLARQQTPQTPSGGGSGGGKPIDEPKTVKEAKLRVRA